MYLETQNQQPAVNVYPNGGGNYGGGFGDMFGGMGGGAIFFWLILFFFMMMFMGWGNNSGNNGGNNGGPVYVPYGAPYMMGASYDSAAQAVRNGFDQAAVVNGIGNLGTQVQAGFNSAEVSRCNQQANILAQMNNNQNATNTQLQNLNMGLQNCCCESRQAIAQLGYNIATEACADRQAVSDALTAVTAQNNANMNALMTQFNNGVQTLKDDFCDFKMAQKDAQIAELQRQLTTSQIAGMVNGSRDAIITNNELQTAALEQYLAPTPRPAYIVQNSSCCNQGYNRCCGN